VYWCGRQSASKQKPFSRAVGAGKSQPGTISIFLRRDQTMMKRHLLTAALSAFVFAGCEVGPDYERPPVETPTSFKESGDWQLAQPMDQIDRGAWWSVYQDPVLNDLEKQVDINNQNIKNYEAQYQEALSLADEARSSLFPIVTTDPSVTRSGSGGLPSTTKYTLGASGSWDIDLWGKIQRNLESYEANGQALAGDLASARLTAQAQVATDYFELRIQDQLIRLLNDTIVKDNKALTITKNQYKVGVAAMADVLTAQTQLESVNASAINANVSRTQLEHAIAVLIGKPPAALTIAVTNDIGRIPNIPTEMPSRLLERRPDIAAAERQVAAENAQIGVAVAAWYPDLALNANYGTIASAFSKVLQASTAMWSFGPTLAETIFDGGERQAKVRYAEAGFQAAVATYRQTTLTAFQQVEDDLSAMRILGEQAVVEDKVVADARKAERLTLNQYTQGIVNFTTVLTAQIVTLTNEETALQVQSNRLTDSVALIQALGGGWDTSQLPAPEGFDISKVFP